MATLAMASAIAIALLPTGPIGHAPRQAVLRRASPLRCEAAPPTEIEVPKMESACGFDFVPLLTALQVRGPLSLSRLRSHTHASKPH